ncbi:hypothetical protein LCGC14_1479140, partial [marine sediment metagenome]
MAMKLGTVLMVLLSNQGHWFGGRGGAVTIQWAAEAKMPDAVVVWSLAYANVKIRSGHIGLTAQSSGQLGGHKAQGRTAESAKLVIEDALAIEEAGAQLLLIEAVPPEVSGFIAQKLSIPVLSIGAGLPCDGQLLIVSDLIGQFQAFTPKFVKKYANIAEVITKAMAEYAKDVKAGAFPEDEHCY